MYIQVLCLTYHIIENIIVYHLNETKRMITIAMLLLIQAIIFERGHCTNTLDCGWDLCSKHYREWACWPSYTGKRL